MTVCSNCQAKNIATDMARGCVYCEECGMVQEENTIVSSLQFDSSGTKATLHGKIISVDNANVGTQFVDSSFYIKNTISSICNKLSLGTDHVECAFRWYKLCLQHSLSKGKSILYTLSACVYVSCRQEGTPHLLIDFSNALRIDMFRVGRVFLKLRSLLGIDIPLVDPSLYMHRFVSQLKFQNNEILDFSVRLVARMKKDWILAGRRPNNSCGAALLIASRIFNEERHIAEVAKVVSASVSTVSKRLREIAETESANLGIFEFKDVWISEEDNPPIMKKIKRSKRRKPILRDIYSSPTDSIERGTRESEEHICVPVEDVDSDVSNFDIDGLILNEDEVKSKQEIWESLYGDFVIERDIKRKNKPRSVKKRRQNRYSFDTIEEAFQCLDQRVSSKLNYAAIEGLFTG
ncbi:transcription factor IIIB 90 kDa subunit [Pancytospora epiphaga]|nr:transcription factor IIIB 90 kDa subunit [Pancytospora epiphaga]